MINLYICIVNPLHSSLMTCVVHQQRQHYIGYKCIYIKLTKEIVAAIKQNVYSIENKL